MDAEPSYEDGEVVWVKWSSCWWPGEVWARSRVPNDLMSSSSKKPVIAYVKFFQEESFECVKSHNNILKYDCDKKIDFIKKGMDKHRANVKVMENFPADVVKAEQLTKGDPNILKGLETPTKQKPNSSATVVKPTTPIASPDQRPTAVSKKAAGAYNSSTKVQLTASPAPKTDKKFTCTLCDFATDRMNLLMFHIKNHSSTYSPRVSDPMPVAIKKTSTAKSPSKRAEPGDSIADDVRKIKESLKKTVTKPAPTPKKPREPATRGTPRGRGAKKEEKVVYVKEVPKVVEEKPKEVINILADWDDDDDDMDVPKKEEKPADLPKLPLPKPEPLFEKVGESSRTIRNIPKKQRVSEVYIKAAEVEQPKIETPAKSPIKESPKKVEEPQDEVAMPEVAKKPQKSNKRKIAIDLEEPKKVADEATDDLLMATAELLNETEVPKVENAQVPSTFHKSNDIDKRNLPPKERNKRIFRANNAESPPTMPTENNGSMTKVEEPVIASPIQNELMLPHKKKQSSRLAATEKPSPVRETRNVRQEAPLKQEVPLKTEVPLKPEVPMKLDMSVSPPPVESRTRKKRKSTEPKAFEVETNSHKVPAIEAEQEVTQSPLREPAEPVPTEPAQVPNSTSSPRRGVKRQNSKDLHELTQDDPDVHSEPKKLHKFSADTQPKTIVACASEAICITSKGLLEKTCKDSLVTTEANSVMVTSQVIITEAILQPIVSSAPTQSPKMQISTNSKSSAPKDALKVPPAQLKEMKKQGLVVEEGGKQKLTKEGRLVFKKQMKEKTVDAEKKEPEPAPEQAVEAPTVVIAQNTDTEPNPVNPETIAEVVAVPAETESRLEVESRVEPEVEESTNNNDIEKESIVAEPSTPSKEPQHEESMENGKEAETDGDSQSDDPNGGSGLIALQADTFGGPQNCFYLCRQIEDRYEPVDNQILVLNQHNALVPFEGDIEALSTQGVVAESMSSFPQLSPNANIIINTPNGQKIELNQYAIQTLQEQADENGIASIELSGEQLELNIHGILEAIHAQQESAETEGILPGAMLIDGESALILDVPELPIEINHSATQVSETLSKPIMSTTVAPEITSVKATITDSTKNLNIEDSLASIGVTTPTRSNVPKSLELPITITNPTIAETVNRKHAHVPVLELGDVALEADAFVMQATDNGSQD